MRILMIFLCLIFMLNLSATIINVPADQPTIQAGINVAVNGDTILVAPGTYFENITWPQTNGIKLIGSGENNCFIDGNSITSVIRFEDLTVAIDESTLIEGFTITNGLASGTYPYNNGGGIYCSQSNPSLENLSIINNTAISWGGGIHCYLSNPTLENVTIIGNSAEGGGGIGCYFSDPIMENVTIISNSASSLGGGFFCYNNSDATLVNVTIIGNSAEGGGGIMCYTNSYSTLKNVTISGNTSNDGGGGILCADGSGVDLINCILWNNSPDEVSFLIHFWFNEITLAYSNIEGGWSGIHINNNGTLNWLEGNIYEEPLFVGTGDYPFSLQDLSPCVNTGIPDTTGLNLPEYDLAGNPRTFGGRIDMGAYENQNVVVAADESQIPNTTVLYQNHPNPFNPTTTISFSVTQTFSFVNLEIFNLKGQKVKTLIKNYYEKGNHSIIWNGDDESENPVSSGVYLYKLKINGKMEAVRKCILLK